MQLLTHKGFTIMEIEVAENLIAWRRDFGNVVLLRI